MELLTCDNLILAEKLRNDDPEQFYILVKMHLSFVLDLNMDESDGNSAEKQKFRTPKWNLPFSKKPKPYNKSCLEGSHLTTEFIEQMRHLIAFLSLEENICQEGIFRRSGKVTRQQELKTLINNGVAINLNDGRFSVHDCATVLKNILSELPESVLTDAHFPAYCQIADLCTVKSVNSEDRLLKSLQLLILLLPTENKIFFQDIIALLNLAASHESKNRMSADNLATLFTPHLLCPRKLSPEALHMNSQVMSRVVAFMIQKGGQLFEIPLTLATDLQAYWNKKERRRMSPLKQMNESVCDGTAANTVFSFVDRERTARENGANPTETALAQLYAYIQSLPESSKKRKLIKQFNKENGHGTPLRAMAGKKRARSRSIGDSIKKHLPVFTKANKRSAQALTYGEDECNSSALQDKSKSTADEPQHNKSKEVARENKDSVVMNGGCQKTVDETQADPDSQNKPVKYLSCDANSGSSDEPSAVEDTDANTSEKRNSSSPIENLSPCKLTYNGKSDTVLDQVRLFRQWPVSSSIKIDDKVQGRDSVKAANPADGQVPLLKTPCRHASRRQVDSQGFVEPAVYDNLMRTPSRKLSSNGNLPRFTNTDFFMSSPNNTNRMPIRYCSKSHLLVTSTPAPGSGCLVTPIVDKNNSMSPITRSTQRMPKAMQETMMTPRSRKPVISLSGTGLCHLATMDSAEYLGLDKKPNDFGKKLILEDANETTDSLSSTFRDYLFSRSELTTSPADLSFSSRTDDFLSLSDHNSSMENEEEFKSLPESMLNEEEMSESLLYCLDGNDPEDDADDDEASNATPAKSYTDDPNEVNHVYETAL